jgi:tetratricopeptide (TPR) repeat protein
VEARRPEEALAPLGRAAQAERPLAKALYFLGRCQLALDRPADAVATLRRALELATLQKAGDYQLGGVHYQLAQALRRSGSADEAATHFAEAERYSAAGAQGSREQLARYLEDVPDPAHGPETGILLLESSPVAGLTAAERRSLEGRVQAALARAHANLGVMQAQSARFARAADLFAQAADIDPDFPRIQFSLGLARFNAQQFDAAKDPLSRALAAEPSNAQARRMLALSLLHVESYERAAELLRDDPERASDPSLQYAYGLALVRSKRGAEAEVIFARLLREHGDTAELNVVLGQAHAQDGNYAAAIESLQRALAQKPDVAEANAALGVIYLKQGKLPEAEAALQAALASHPSDLKSRHNLATVLDLAGRPQAALPLLRAVLKAKPDFADARYLLGKILLAEGAAAEAVEHLEAAVRLSPDEAGAHYQLAQAYQKLGRAEQAQQEFERFRQIKDKRRGSAS